MRIKGVWCYLGRALARTWRAGLALFVLNFSVIAWQNIHMYQATQLAVLGVDALFLLTSCLLYSWLWGLVPWRPLRRGALGISVGVSLLLWCVELFTIVTYQTQVGAGIVTAILQTNPQEAGEYLRMYVGWRGLVLLALVLVAIYAVQRWRRTGMRQRLFTVHSTARPAGNQTVRLRLWAGLLLPLLAVAWGSGYVLWTQWHSFVINDSLDIPLVRIAAATDTAVTNIRAFKQLQNEAAADVELTANNSDVPYVVFILGESTSRARMHLYGYPLENTPNLDELAAKGEIAVYQDAITPATATVAALRRLLTFADNESQKPWYEHNNIMDVMHAAGYRTYWLSNQESSGIWGNVAQLFASRADESHFTQPRESHEENGNLDERLFPMVDEMLARPAAKNFYVIHLMGGHGLYYLRYPYLFTKFMPEDVPAPQDTLPDDERLEVAQYENALYYNDFIVSSLMGKFADKEALVIYLPDHGEDLYDNGRHFSGHVEEHPTKATCEVPLIFWASPAYRAHHPEKWQAICAAVNRPYMTDDIIHTLLDVLDIHTVEYDATKSVVNPAFDASRRRIVYGQDYDAVLK